MSRSSTDEHLKILLSGAIDPSVKSSFDKVESYSKRLQNKVENLAKTQSKGEAWKILRGEVTKTEASYNKLIGKSEALEKAISLKGKASREQRRELKALQKELSTTSRTLDFQRNSIKDLSEDLKKAGFNTDKFARSQANLQRRISFGTSVYRGKQFFEDKLSSFKSNADRNRAIRSNVQSSAFSTAMVAGVGYLPIVQGSLLEHEAQKVKAVTKYLEDKAPLEYRIAYRKLFEKLRTIDTPYDMAKVYKGVQQLGKGGLNPDEARDAIIHVLNTASSSLGETSPESAADILTDIAGGFGIKKNHEGMKRLSNVFVGVTSTSSTTIQDVFETLKYVGNVSSFLESKGRGLEMIGSYIGLLASRGGIKGSTPGTALRQIYSSILKGGEKMDFWSKELGVKFINKDGKFRSLDRIFKSLAMAFEEKKYSKAQKSKAVFEMFDLRAGPSALKMIELALDKKDGFDVYLNKIQQMSRGSVAKDTATEAYDDIVGDALRLKKSVSVFSEDFTQLFGKDIRKLLVDWKENINSFRGYVSENPETFKAIGSGLKNLLLLKGGMLAGKLGYSLISDLAGAGMLAGGIAVKGAGKLGKGVGKTARWSMDTISDLAPLLLPFLFGRGDKDGKTGKVGKVTKLFSKFKNLKNLKTFASIGKVGANVFRWGKLLTAFSLPSLAITGLFELAMNFDTVVEKIGQGWEVLKGYFQKGYKFLGDLIADPENTFSQWSNDIESWFQDKNKYGFFATDSDIQAVKNREEEHFSQIHTSNYNPAGNVTVNNVYNVNSSEAKNVVKEISSFQTKDVFEDLLLRKAVSGVR